MNGIHIVALMAVFLALLCSRAGAEEKSSFNSVNICADGLSAQVGNAANQAEADERIANWVKGFADSGAVDVMLFNTNYNVSLIQSDVFDTAWRKIDGTPVTAEQLDAFHHWHADVVRAHEKGIEPYGSAIRHTRANGMSPWFSVRINEWHYLNRVETAATLWLEHPEYRIEPHRPFDFRYQEVQDYYLAYIKELCANWDIDGIEIDMMRIIPGGGPQLTGAELEYAVERMNSFMRSVRAIADEASAQKGRRIQVSVRVRDLPQTCRQNWCDVVLWVQEGLVDGITLGAANNYNASVALWRQMIGEEAVYFLQVGGDYGNVCIPDGDKRRRTIQHDTESMKGYLDAALFNGADGVYIFNLNRPNMFDYSQIVNGAAARSGWRRHVLGGYGDGWQHDLPIRLDPNLWANLFINAGSGGSKVQVRVGVWEMPEKLDVLLNYKPCAPLGRIEPEEGKGYVADGMTYGYYELTQAAPYVLEFELDMPVKAGSSTVSLHGDKDTEVIWLELRILGDGTETAE